VHAGKKVCLFQTNRLASAQHIADKPIIPGFPIVPGAADASRKTRRNIKDSASVSEQSRGRAPGDPARFSEMSFFSPSPDLSLSTPLAFDHHVFT